MATKTTKKKGETTTTVSVGIRIDPKIKFALDLMGRLQKRSLTAVIEWAISNAISQQLAGPFNQTMSELVDGVWSTDEATRFVNLCYLLPEALTYDELRVWETIKASPVFWKNKGGGDWKTNLENLDMWMVQANWDSIQFFVDEHKTKSTLLPMSEKDLILL